ncbi:hypothetical protein SXCC_00033 [Gluconacetobacter sp. SXCC-1]|nr:hypothetical protein SXCC_00358 [Gluconacetobacter sp. SXCC-1]EGG79295.1 hypothetical protein SXCC_00033 [Gluconacetobacter sp. SXCC-1]
MQSGNWTVRCVLLDLINENDHLRGKIHISREKRIETNFTYRSWHFISVFNGNFALLQ